MILNVSKNNVRLVAETKVKRIYGQHDVSDMTLSEVEDVIEDDDIEYSADYGFQVQDNSVNLIFSRN